MGIQISKAFNANIYIDGTNDQLGRASEVKLPDVAPEMVEHKGLGMIGTVELPSGLKAMTMSVKWAGIYADSIKFGGNPFRAHRFQLRASVETYDAHGRSSETPLVVLFSGTWKKAGGITFKPKEGTESEDEVAVSYIKVILGGRPLYEVDVLNNVWLVGGEDVIANLKANLSG